MLATIDENEENASLNGSGGSKITNISADFSADIEKKRGLKMDFRKFKNLNVNIKNIDVKINCSVWDRQPILYNGTDTIDGIRHTITVTRCGYWVNFSVG